MNRVDGPRTTRVLMEGTYTYHRRVEGGNWMERVPTTARVFILEWFEAGTWSDIDNRTGRVTKAVVVFREEAWLGELLDPIPVGSIREIEASSFGETFLVADVS